jgi:hypothetical protein
MNLVVCCSTAIATTLSPLGSCFTMGPTSLSSCTLLRLGLECGGFRLQRPELCTQLFHLRKLAGFRIIGKLPEQLHVFVHRQRLLLMLDYYKHVQRLTYTTACR